MYDVDEDDRLDTDFRLNVKGFTAFPGLNLISEELSQLQQLALQVRLRIECVVSSLKYISPCSKL